MAGNFTINEIENDPTFQKFLEKKNGRNPKP